MIPVATKANGELKKTSKTVSKAALNNVCYFAMDRIEQFGNEIIEGKVDLAPYKMGNTTACDYCEYGSVCGFDAKLPGSNYRRLFAMDTEDVWSLFREKRKEKETIEEEMSEHVENRKGGQDNE